MTDKLTPLGLVSPNQSHIELPLAQEGVQAGFPAPNGGYIEGDLDVNDFLITSPSSTYIYQVSGDSMCEAGIMHGDYVLVDSSRQARSGDIVVASVDNEFTIKKLVLGKRNKLVPCNCDYSEIEITENSRVVIIGPVISVIRKYH